MALDIPSHLAISQELLDYYGVTTEEREITRRTCKDWAQAKGVDAIALRCLLRRETYRLDFLYNIKDGAGQAIPFRYNEAQRYVASKTHNRKMILKSRKHGMTTKYCIKYLDKTLFNATQRAGIVAQTEDDARNFLNDKVKFAYLNLPDFIKNHPAHSLLTERMDLLAFGPKNNPSSIYVDCSLKSDTVQFLLLSEYGWICHENPEKAESIINGALNAVFPGAEVVIESTSERLGVDFQERCKEAMNLALLGKKLNKLEFQFIFLGWFCDWRNRLNPKSVTLTKEEIDYFRTIEPEIKRLASMGVMMDNPFADPVTGGFRESQKAWYAAKRREQKRLMQTQHPSCVTGDMLVGTPQGLVRMADVEPDGVYITAKYDKGIQDVYEIKTRLGYSVKATIDHPVLLASGEFVEVGNLNFWEEVVIEPAYLSIRSLDTIASIVYVGEEPVYDITTSTKQFSAGGIVVHNCPKEAIEGETEGRYFKDEITAAYEQKRVRICPYTPGYPVNTSWDFGSVTAVWFHQNVRGEDRLINYYEEFKTDFPDDVRYMQGLGYHVWGYHYIPHDGEHFRKGIEVTNYKQILEQLGLRNIISVPRATKKKAARSVAKGFLSSVVFDEVNCSKGLDHLNNYSMKWNNRLKIYMEDEMDDEHTHCSDSVICMAEGRLLTAGESNKSAAGFLKGRKRPPSTAFR